MQKIFLLIQGVDGVSKVVDVIGDTLKKLTRESIAQDKSASSYKVSSYNAALKDITRMEGDRARWNKTVAAEISRTDKMLADNKIKEFRRAGSEAIRVLNDFQKTNKQSGNFSKDFAQQTFLGSLVGSSAGSIAGGAFTRAISEVVALGREIGQLGISAIQTGAEFEKTVNSLSVFAGGASNAQRELAALDETARNTAGLRLEPAEAGYRQLRALGFEAENARKLIAGIGKERLLSGANEMDVQRVIVNLTQLSAGSNRAGQDIKEIFHSMPALRKEFALAFGTLDPKKIAAVFGKDPQEAIKKISAQLEKTQGAAGGLEDAWGKLSDEFIMFGREASKSIIPDLTNDIKALTSYMREGGNEVSNFGVRIANLYNALKSNNPKDLFDLVFLDNETSNRIFRARKLKALSFEDYVKQQTGSTVEDLKTYKQSLSDILSGAEPNMEAKRRMMNLNIGYNTYLNQREDELLRPERESAYKQAEADAEVARQNALDKARTLELGRLDAYYSQVASIRQTAFQIAEAQNENNLEKVAQIRRKDFAEQLAETRNQYARKLTLTDDSEEETYKLTVERNNKIRQIQTAAQLDELKLQKQINQQKRDDALRFNQLTVSDLSNFVNKLSAEFGNFSSIQDATISGFAQLNDLLNQQFQIQLQNESLTAGQRTNIIREMYQEQSSLAQQQADKLADIEEKRHEQFVDNLKIEAERFRDSLKNRGQIFSQIQSQFFKPSIQFGEGFKKFGLGILDTGIEANAVDQIDGVLKGRISLYQAQKSVLEKTHIIEKVGLEREIDLNKDLIELEKIRLKTQVNTTIANLQGNYDRLLNERQRVLGENSSADVSSFQQRADAIQKQIQDLKNLTDKDLEAQSPGVKRLKKDIQDAADALQQLSLSQAGQNQDLYEQSTEGLKEFYEALASGQKDGIISQIAENDLWRQRIDLLTQNKILQIEITNTDFLGALRAQQKELLFIAENSKSAAESVTDFKLTIADGVFQQIDSPFEKMRQSLEKFPPILRGVGNAFINLANDIVRGFSQKLIYQLFGIGNGSGGFNLGGLFGSIFGRGSLGGNPGFNPNVTGSISRLADSTLATNVFGGGSLPNVTTTSTITDLNGNIVGRAGGSGGGWLDWLNQQTGGNFGVSSSESAGKGKFSFANGFALAGIGASLLGSVIGGKAGGILSGAGTGITLGMSIGSIIPGLGTVVGGAIGGLIGGIAGIFTGDPKRKADKAQLPQLQKGFQDAFAEFRILIDDVNALRADPDSALAKGRELRSAIANSFGLTWQSKKYRKQSQELIKQQLAAIDAVPSGLMEQLKNAVDMAKAAGDRSKRILPEFADGGAVSKFFASNFAGLVPGAYDRRDDKLIRVSGNEVVLTPNQWRPIAPYLSAARVPGFADGGAMSATTVQSNLNVKVELHNVEAKPGAQLILTTEAGKRQVIDIYKEAKKNREI